MVVHLRSLKERVVHHMLTSNSATSNSRPYTIVQLRKCFARILKATIRGERAREEDISAFNDFGRAAKTEGGRPERNAAALYDAMVVLLLEAAQIDR